MWNQSNEFGNITSGMSGYLIVACKAMDWLNYNIIDTSGEDQEQ